jgi:hypothetical protein
MGHHIVALPRRGGDPTVDLSQGLGSDTDRGASLESPSHGAAMRPMSPITHDMGQLNHDEHHDDLGELVRRSPGPQ